MKALWNNIQIAQSNETVIVEGNHYFPKESLDMSFFKDSSTTSLCPWKGEASYYSLEVNGEINQDAAWFYSKPTELAQNIKDKVAFWKGVQVVD